MQDRAASLPCQYCGSAKHRSAICPQMIVCLTCKTKSHSSHYICPLLQNPAVRQAQGHKSYHSDDPSLSHHSVGLAKPDVSGATKDIHVSPVSPHVTTAFHPP